MSRSVEFLLIAALSAVVLSGCKKERSFRGANPGDEIVFGGTAGSASGFRSSKTKGGDGDSSVAGALSGTGLDASNMESCVSYDSDADETYFFDWEDFEGGDALGGSSADNEIHKGSSVVKACKCLSGSAGSESLSGGESGVSCGDGISGAYSDDRANGISSFGSSDAGNGLFGVKDSDVQTKTEYSGHKENVGGKKYERIDWVAGDKVRIFGDNVLTSGGAPSEMVYKVTSPSIKTGDASRSSASLEKESAGTMGLRWDSGNADFYAVYPGNSPTKVSAFNATSNFDVTVKLPKEQYIPNINISVNHTEVKPDMELAAMMAVSRNVSPASSVQLDFLPLVTTFRISIGNPSTTDDITINKVSICYTPSASTPKPMSGDYAVQYDKASGGTLSSHSSVGLQPVNTSSITSPEQEISVDLGTDAVTLTKNNGNTLSVTLFAVPVQHKGLQLKINVTQGGNTEDRILYLEKKQTAPFNPAEQLEFEPYKKYDINVGVDDKKWTYSLEFSSPSIGVLYTGGIISGWIRSYKTDGNTIQPASWRVEGYSETGPTGLFTSTSPGWFINYKSFGFGVSSSSGTEAITAKVSAQTLTITTDARTTALRSKDEVGSKADPIDLSKVPVENAPYFSIGDGASASIYKDNPMNTANCYVVTRPGWYKIPVVYGNSIKNGSYNTEAYNPSVSHPNVLKPFIRHDGNAISSPWINDNISLSTGVAELLWQDQKDLVQNIQLESNKKFIVFHVSQSTIHEGNAVIALKASATGDIVWSWHIWVYGGDNLKAINVKNNKAKVTPPKPGRDNFDFLSENLGACYDGDLETYPESNVWVKVTNGRKTEVIKITRFCSISASKYNNTYYQWGRKDPMLPSDGISNNNKAWYDKDGVKHLSFFPTDRWDSDGTAPGANAEIVNTIKYPGMFNTYDYMDNYYYNLWDASCNETSSGGLTDARLLPVTKSVYDPCPPGFCLPPGGAFTGFTKNMYPSMTPSELNLSGPFSNGYNFRTVLKDESGSTTIFLPASGYRNDMGGASLVGDYGYYGSGLSHNANNMLIMFFYSGFVFTNYNRERSFGFVLRPVKEI